MYFSYHTRPATQVNHKYEADSPIVSICVDYESILLERELERMFGKSVEAGLKNLTLNQLFKLVPKPNGILSSCALNIPNKQTSLGHKDAAEVCYQNFKIVRYFIQTSICYNLELKHRVEYNFFRVTQEDYGRIYEFNLDKNLFSNVSYLQVVIFNDDLPFTSSHYAKHKQIRFNNQKIKFNRFRYTYSIFKYSRLPPPYDTNCSRLGYTKCNTKCFVELMSKQFKKLPTEWQLPENPMSYESGDIFGNYDLPFVKEHELANHTFYRLRNSLYEHCARKCNSHSCDYNIHGTTLFSAEEVHTGAIAIYIYLPLSPFTEVTFHPLFPFNDYLIYIMSCLGTWLGLSVTSLNPTKLLRKQNTVRNRATCCVCCHRSTLQFNQELNGVRACIQQLKTHIYSKK